MRSIGDHVSISLPLNSYIGEAAALVAQDAAYCGSVLVRAILRPEAAALTHRDIHMGVHGENFFLSLCDPTVHISPRMTIG